MEELRNIREEITAELEGLSSQEIADYINELAHASRELTGLILREPIADKITAP